jgi:ABC-type lipoprotein release transport system permease subunit
MSSVLFDVSPTDPATLFAVSAVLALVAIVAACVPAMRAMRVDPATVLRYQ